MMNSYPSLGCKQIAFGLATEVALPLLAKITALCLILPSTLTASMFEAIRLPMYKLRPNQSKAIAYGAPTIPES